MDAAKLDRILPILRCPRSGSGLNRCGSELISQTGERYPIVNGKPILVRVIKPLHITPPEIAVISQNIDEYVLQAEVAAMSGIKVHLGSGNVPCTDPEVISVDILPTEHADLVAEAECLPFSSESLVWIESGAVFEHLYDPLAAAREVRRVLAAGGGFRIDTAFMQSYHGFPCHYFNMTAQAVETFIVDDFELISSYVPVSSSASTSVENLLSRFVEVLPGDVREKVLKMSTAQLLIFLADARHQSEIHERMSEHMQRALGASTCVVARKPVNYLGSSSLNADSDFAVVRRDYYSARVAVMQRFSEIEFYRSRTLEKSPTAKGPRLPKELASILESCLPLDTLNSSSWMDGFEGLKSADSNLTEVRDEWIRLFLERDAAPTQSAKKGVSEDSGSEAIATVHDLSRSLDSLNAELIRVKSSWSWRITAPLRVIRAIAKS